MNTRLGLLAPYLNESKGLLLDNLQKHGLEDWIMSVKLCLSPLSKKIGKEKGKLEQTTVPFNTKK